MAYESKVYSWFQIKKRSFVIKNKYIVSSSTISIDRVHFPAPLMLDLAI